MNAQHSGVPVDFQLANGESLPFEDKTFDVVYGHGVLQYTAEPRRMVEECRRVLDSRRRGHLHGLQPYLLAQRAIKVDEGRTRARRCTGPEKILDR